MCNIRKTIMALIMIFAIALSFTSKYDALIDELKSTGSSKQSSINDYIVLNGGFIESITIFGNGFLHQEHIDEGPTIG